MHLQFDFPRLGVRRLFVPRRRDAARCKRREIPCRMAPLWLLWGKDSPNGGRRTEEVANICITAIISSAARRSMNIRALTARRNALDAARSDLFAHIIFVVLRRRRAERLRFPEGVAIRCMFANTFSAARRSMNIRALTAGGGVLEAARGDLFAHTILAAILQRGGDLPANDRGGCNGCKIAIANVLARHPSACSFYEMP